MCACSASRPRGRRARAVILRHAFTPADNPRLAHLCGPLDENLRTVESALGVRIARRHERLRIDGAADAAQAALALLQRLYADADRPIEAEALQQALREPPAAAQPDAAPIVLHTRRADLAARSPNQLRYLRQMLTHDISFGIGPAGTGKTFLAVACAVDLTKLQLKTSLTMGRVTFRNRSVMSTDSRASGGQIPLAIAVSVNGAHVACLQKRRSNAGSSPNCFHFANSFPPIG